jgi:phosphate transport system substrate-binding protein
MRRIVLLAVALALAACASGNAPVRLLETGSTLLYPLVNLWVAAYQETHHDVQITTQGTGSGTGISQAASGVAQIGASDAYMPDGAMRVLPMLNIPLAVSAQLIIYNLPGLGGAHLRVSGPILAAIYGGRMQYWDDPAILAVNPALRGRLPHHLILPIFRSDGSGDTFIFTQYLSDTTPSWRNGPGYGTSVSWPSSNAVGANGNPGVLQIAQSARYAIGYIGISFMEEVRGSDLGYAALENLAGAYVLPEPSTIAAAANARAPQTPVDERLSLIDAPGERAYPLVNYEYAIVNPHQPDAKVRKALVSFLGWTLSAEGGQRAAYLSQVYFAPLPPSVQRLSLAQVERIH